MEGIQYPLPRTVEDVFADFRGRRSGFIKALSINALDFYNKCDPEKDNVCLYGLPDGSWMVNLPVDELPPELPEPTLGINFARGGMPWKDWISLVAVHSDSWLVSIAYYFAARFGFGKNERKRLFDMINDLPTVFEVITSYTKQSKATKLSLPIREEDESGDEEEEDDDDDEQVSSCAACGQSNGEDEFWILCDTCEKWFHGRCVRITPAKAKLMKHYKCPSCVNKKPRV